MELTLRQARNLETRLRNLQIKGQLIEVRAYDSSIALKDLSEGISELGKEIDLKIELNAIRHRIKHALNVRNMECGVSATLNKRDSLFSKRELFTSLGSSDSANRQIKFIEENPKDHRMVSAYVNELEYSVQSDIKEINEELAVIAASLADMNNNVTIEISEEDAELLKGARLL